MNEESIKQKPYNLALASVVLGFFGISLAALVCGHLALIRINQNKNGFTDTDKRLAIGGLFFGYLGSALWLYLLFLIGEIFFNLDFPITFK